MNFRPTAQLAELHRDGNCRDDCPSCALIDAVDPEPHDRDYLIQNYPEGWREP